MCSVQHDARSLLREVLWLASIRRRDYLREACKVSYKGKNTFISYILRLEFNQLESRRMSKTNTYEHHSAGLKSRASRNFNHSFMLREEANPLDTYHTNIKPYYAK